MPPTSLRAQMGSLCCAIESREKVEGERFEMRITWYRDFWFSFFFFEKRIEVRRVRCT